MKRFIIGLAAVAALVSYLMFDGAGAGASRFSAKHHTAINAMTR